MRISLPDDISTLPILHNLVRKILIHLDIVNPGVILVSLALWVIRNLVMEDWPKDLFAVMRVMAVKIAILAEDCQGIVLGSQPVLDILLLLRIFESVRGHTQCPNPDLFVEIPAANCGLYSIS